MQKIISEIKTKAKQLTVDLFKLENGLTKEQLHENALDLLLKVHELETIYSQTCKNDFTHTKKKGAMVNNENLIKNEINKLNRRIPLWANRQHQINSKILTLFLRMEEEGISPITEELLIERYDNYSEFSTNFQQMKTMATNNHGKVFNVKNESVKIWEPIRQIVSEYKKTVFGNHSHSLNESKQRMHTWSYDDDIVAYYLTKYGENNLEFDFNTICSVLDIKPGSMNMRIGNFKALEGHEDGALHHTAKLSERVFNDFQEKSEEEHLVEVKNILY